MWFIVKGEQGNFVDVVENHPEPGSEYECRTDWTDFEDAEFAADFASVYMDKPFLAIDQGPGIYPRYDIIQAPQIGDDVSYGFNGDYYPAGKIVTISKTMKRITTDKGECFYGDPKSGQWHRKGGKTWSMVKGVHNERNPNF